MRWRGARAAVLIATLVVTGLTAGCGAQGIGAVSSSKPTPVKDYGPPPAGVPLLYVHDPDQASWLIAFDWSGNPRGTVKLPAGMDQTLGLSMSPDGSAFQVGAGGKGGSGTYLDRLGRPIPNGSMPATEVGGIWADDNRHQCTVTLDQQNFVWGLSTALPGEAPKEVAVIARDPGIGQTGISVASCSFAQNLAVLVRTTIWWPTELWVVRLSDGQFLAHHTFEATALVTVVSSVDGMYVAESSSYAHGLNPRGAAKTTIRRVSNWSAAATLDPSFQVLTFSADGSLVLVTTQLDTGQAGSHVAVVDWRSGRVVWAYAGPESLYRSIAQPGGSDFALALRAPTIVEPSPCGLNPPCRQIEDPLNDLLLVHGDGTTTSVAGRYEPLF